MLQSRPAPGSPTRWAGVDDEAPDAAERMRPRARLPPAAARRRGSTRGAAAAGYGRPARAGGAVRDRARRIVSLTHAGKTAAALSSTVVDLAAQGTLMVGYAQRALVALAVGCGVFAAGPVFAGDATRRRVTPSSSCTACSDSTPWGRSTTGTASRRGIERQLSLPEITALLRQQAEAELPNTAVQQLLDLWERYVRPQGQGFRSGVHLDDMATVLSALEERSRVRRELGASSASDLSKLTLGGASESAAEVLAAIQAVVVPFVTGKVDGRQLYLIDGPSLGGPEPLRSTSLGVRPVAGAERARSP
jgi:hypothetical protein